MVNCPSENSQNVKKEFHQIAHPRGPIRNIQPHNGKGHERNPDNELRKEAKFDVSKFGGDLDATVFL